MRRTRVLKKKKEDKTLVLRRLRRAAAVVEHTLLGEVWLGQCDQPCTARCVEKLSEAQGQGFINKPKKRTVPSVTLEMWLWKGWKGRRLS